MFSFAWQRAAPLLGHLRVWSKRRGGDEEIRHTGTYVNLDDRGWVATAAHVLQPLDGGTGSSISARLWDDGRREELAVYVYQDVDIALCRLSPISLREWPVMRPGHLHRLGDELLTLGFLHNDNASARLTSGEPRAHDGPETELYGVRGMASRIIRTQDLVGETPVSFLETSATPRRGQSGGVTVDPSGVIWGMQIRAHHEILGYDVAVDGSGRRFIERQVANTTIVVRTDVLAEVMSYHGVDVHWS